MNLLMLVRIFMDKHPEYSTERGAKCQCWRASVKFARMCRIYGYAAHVGSGYMHGSYHAVVIVNSIIIDFTARQFKGDYPPVRVKKLDLSFEIDHHYDYMLEPLPDRSWEEQYA